MLGRPKPLCILLLSFVAVAAVQASNHTTDCRPCDLEERCCNCKLRSCEGPNFMQCDSPASKNFAACGDVDCSEVCKEESDPPKQGPPQNRRNDHADERPCCAVRPTQGCPKPNPDAEECGGEDAGTCEQVGNAYKCNCKDGFLPPSCFNTTEFANSNQDRMDKFEGAEKAKEYKERKDSQCNETFPVLCPDHDDVPAQFKDTCQIVILDCFDGNATKFAMLKEEREEQCEANEQYCDIDGCVRKGIPCTAVSDECPKNRPHRCADWTCVAQDSQCKPSTTCQAPNNKLCADGVTCAQNLEKCSEMGIQWEGCGDGLIECPGRKHFCAANASQCEALGACGDGKVFCGIQRNGQGEVVFANGVPLAICKDKCDNEQPTPEPVAAEFGKGKNVQKLISKSEDGVIAVVLQTSFAESFVRADNLTDGVNFTIGPVSSSLIQNGPFRKYFNSGTMMSQPILIEPSAEVVINGGFLLEIPIFDDSIVNETMCLRALSQLSVVTVQDITRFDADVELVATCERGSLANCSCVVNLTHFSAYTVVDSEAQVQSDEFDETDEELDATSMPATTPVPDDSEEDVTETDVLQTDVPETDVPETSSAPMSSADPVGATTPAMGNSTMDNSTTATASSSILASSTMASSTMASSTMASSTMASSTMASSTMASSTMASSTPKPTVDTTQPTPDTTVAPPATFAIKVVSKLSGITATEFLANLDGFRAAVAALHAGRSASDVVVDENSVKDVEVRRRLLAAGVEVAYQVQGFADQAAASSAQATQETALSTLTENLKANGFTNAEVLSSTVTVVDADGGEVFVDDEGSGAEALRAWGLWTVVATASAIALAL